MLPKQKQSRRGPAEDHRASLRPWLQASKHAANNSAEDATLMVAQMPNQLDFCTPTTLQSLDARQLMLWDRVYIYICLYIYTYILASPSLKWTRNCNVPKAIFYLLKGDYNHKTRDS